MEEWKVGTENRITKLEGGQITQKKGNKDLDTELKSLQESLDYHIAVVEEVK